MVKRNFERKMDHVADSQHTTETHHSDKFDAVKEQVAEHRNKMESYKGRKSPQISGTVDQKHVEMLKELELFAHIKKREKVTTSDILRIAIETTYRLREEIEF